MFIPISRSPRDKMQLQFIVLTSTFMFLPGVALKPTGISFYRRLINDLEGYLDEKTRSHGSTESAATEYAPTESSLKTTGLPTEDPKERGYLTLGTEFSVMTEDPYKRSSIIINMLTKASATSSTTSISGSRQSPSSATHPSATRSSFPITTSVSGFRFSTTSAPFKVIIKNDNYWKSFHELRCPIVERILAEKFQGFPSIDDMKGEMAIYSEDLYCIFATTFNMLNLLKKPRLISEYLATEVAEKIVEQKMVCPTTKYQQAVVYALKKNFDHALSFEDRVLADGIWLKLNHFTNAHKILVRIVSSVHFVLFKDLITYILQEEFHELNHMIQDLMDFSENIFKEYANRPQSIFQSQVRHTIWVSWTTRVFKHYTDVLQCTGKDDLLTRHIKIANDTLTGFQMLEETGDLLVLTRELVDDSLTDLIEQDQVHKFPVNDISVLIVDYAHKVMKMVQDYEYELLAGSLQGSISVLRPYFSTDEVEAMSKIVDTIDLLTDEEKPDQHDHHR